MDDPTREKVIEEIIKEIQRVYSASTDWGISTFGKEKVTYAETAKVYSALIKNGKYIGIKRDDLNYDILLNPNYELNEGIKSLNRTLKFTNIVQTCFGLLTAFFIGFTLLISWWQYKKPINLQGQQVLINKECKQIFPLKKDSLLQK